MKRRRFLQAVAAAPALALPAERAVLPQQSPTPVNPPPRPVEEVPKLQFTVPDAAAQMAPHFFNAQQFAALRKLSEILMPAINGAPGALDTGAPEFSSFVNSRCGAPTMAIQARGFRAAERITRLAKAGSI